MIIEKNDDVITLVLSTECAIADVEADADKIRSLINTRPGRIEVQARAIEEIDTAYIQLLLSVALTADHWGIPFSVSNKPETLRKACELYGEDI